MDEMITQTINSKPRPSKGSHFSFSWKSNSGSTKSQKVEDEWGNFVSPCNSAKSSKKQSQKDISKAFVEDDDDVGNSVSCSSAAHISQKLSSSGRPQPPPLTTSGRTPRGAGASASPFLSLRRKDYSHHPNPSHALQIIEDDKELDVSRKEKGTLRSLGSYLSFVTMKVLPRVPMKIGIEGDGPENTEVLDVSMHVSSSSSMESPQDDIQLPTSSSPLLDSQVVSNDKKRSSNSSLLLTAGSSRLAITPSSSSSNSNSGSSASPSAAVSQHSIIKTAINESIAEGQQPP